MNLGILILTQNGKKMNLVKRRKGRKSDGNFYFEDQVQFEDGTICSEVCGTGGGEASYKTLLTVCSLDEFTCSDGQKKLHFEAELKIFILSSGACISMDRRCDQFPNCQDFSDEESPSQTSYNIFSRLNISRYFDKVDHPGKLPAGGEGRQLPARLHPLHCRRPGELDQDGCSDQGLWLTQKETLFAVKIL